MTPRRTMLLFATAVLGLETPVRAQDSNPPGYPEGSSPGNTATGAPSGSATSPEGAANAADESHDSGLGLEWVYLNADVGASYVNLASFNQSQLALQESSSAGPAFGVGAGVRLIFITAGVRLTDLQLSAFNLWQVNAEAAFHTRVWRIDPYFGVRGGYSWVGGFSTNAVEGVTGASNATPAVHGVDVGPVVGIDFYLGKLVSLGIDGTAQFLFIHRPPTPPPDISQLPPQAQMAAMQDIATNPLYQQSGSSVGLGLVFTAHLGIHF
jgi:hypothetical protein